MSLSDEIKKPISAGVAEYEKFIRDLLRSDNRYVSDICYYILSTRGKQMRPLLALLSGALHGEIGPRTYTGAAVIEMMHTASLIHDDVVDEAYVRRGKPSVHALWQSRTAVLVGDYIMARTLHEGFNAGIEDILNVITRTIYEISEGEMLQTEQAAMLTMTEPLYIEIITKKTASLIAAAAVSGAMSAGATEEEVARMNSFGLDIGIAFQIKDDILDFEDSAITGKPSCSDISERKITMPMLYALDKASPSERRKIIALLSDVRRKPGNVAILRDMVIASGGLEYAAGKTREYVARALETLSLYPESPVRHSLELFAEYCAQREK